MAGETRYVTWSGGPSGTYVTDGTDDQAEINQALAWASANPGNTVYLRGPHTYNISNLLLMGSNTVLTGDSTAIIRLENTCMWSSGIPVIGQLGSGGTYAPGTRTTNVEIYGFQIDANEANLTHLGVFDGDLERKWGKGFYNIIYFKGVAGSPVENINVHHMTLHDGMGDGVRINYGKTVRVHDNTMWNLQHSSVFLIDVDGIEVNSNDIQAITNAGVRCDNCREGRIHDNNIRDWTGASSAPALGEHGVQIGNEPASSGHTALTNNINVFNNTINVGGAGIEIEDYLKTAGTNPQNIYIYNNKIHGCGQTTWANYFCGISVYSWGNGVKVEYNTISGNYRAGILVSGAIASGVTATVKNNNITGTVASTDGGYGIWNKVPTTFSVVAENNYLNSNVSGNYLGVTPVSTSASPISGALPGDRTDTDDSTPDTQPGTYLPPALSIITDEEEYFERIPFNGYINGIEFFWQKFSGQGGKVVAQAKSPSVAGWNLSDLDMEGSVTVFDCLAFTIADMNKVLASFYRRGKSIIELGGPYEGYRITGSGESHDSKILMTDDIPDEAHPYTLTFLSEKPYMESVRKRVRSRYIYNSMLFSSDDCYAGNIVRNPSFEEWEANSSLIWESKNAVAANEWRRVRHSPELNQYCAIAATGTPNTLIMISPDGETWAVPSGLPANANNQWRGLVWCPEWGIWVITSITGTGNRCAISPDGQTWTAKTTPVDNSWGDALWIPPNDTLTTGRVICFAYGGTTARIMYSDDQCANWTTVVTPAGSESNNWLSSAYSPGLHRIVVVAYGGSATYRVMTSDDYGATWTLRTCPAQKWTSVVWADTLGLFVVCSEDGTQQIMTSPDGITWTLRDTPYSSSITTGTPESIVNTLAADTAVGYNYTTPTNDYYSNYNPMYSVTLPALSDNHIYRIDNVRCKLRAVSSGPTASLIVTYQIGAGAETQIVEWTETSTTYVPKSLNVAIEVPTGQTLTIRYRLKTSNTAIRAGTTEMGYTVVELTAGGTSITYERNQWRDLVWANPLGLLVCVSQDTTENKVIYSHDAVNWQMIDPSEASGWVSIDFSGEQQKFVAVATTGTNRVMVSDSYGSFDNTAPKNWVFYSPGQGRSTEHVVDGRYSLKIEGDGTSPTPGQTYQTLTFNSIQDAGSRYVLSARGMVEGLTRGNFKVALMSGASIIKELIWDVNEDWSQKQIYFRFDTIPTSVSLWVMGTGIPNAGAIFHCDDIVCAKESDFELAESGSDILTNGTYDIVPNVIVRGVGADITTSSPSTGRVITGASPTDYVYSSAATAYSTAPTSLEWTVTLPALTGNSYYRIDEFAAKLMSALSTVTAYLKVTVKANSLYSGVETTIIEWTTTSTSYQNKSYVLPYRLVTAPGESLQIRFYLKTSNSTRRAYATDFSYKLTEMLDGVTVSTSSLSLYNSADPSRVLKCCNRLPQGYMVEIRNDGTGAYRYVENFVDGAYLNNAYAITGGVVRNATAQTLIMPVGSSIIFMFDTLYPVTGIPFIKLYVISGIPQISIADASGSGGAPGTFYPVDGNTTVGVTNAEVQRELDNAVNLRLRGKTKYYVKIEPHASESCEFGQLLEYATLDTMDAERFFIYATGKANTIGATVGSDGAGKCSMVATLEIRDANILP
mgnify:CR=1 FL=1